MNDHHTSDSSGPNRHSLLAPLPLLLAAVMIIGSLLMWILSPLFWLWVASRVAAATTGSPQPTLPLYLLILTGVIITAALLGRLLGTVNRKHMHITGLDHGHGWRSGWTKSLRDSDNSNRDRGLLEPIMLASVAFAGITATVWFLFFARAPVGG